MGTNRIKILAIDDNQDNLISLKALIREAFPQSIILTALNGINGLELAAAEDPDVILLDVVMPDMDGFEVCQKLKEDKKLCDIPVVFVTALKGDKESRIRALECGAEAFLAKPIDESELTAQIRAMVKIKAANVEKYYEKARLATLVGEKTCELNNAYNATLTLLEELKKENEARKLSEDALRKSENSLIEAQRVAHIGSWRWDAVSDVIWWSSELYRIYGRNPDFPPSSFENDQKNYSPESAAQLAAVVQKSMQSGEPYIVDLELDSHNSPARWVQARGEAVRNAGGQIVGLRGTVQDITEHKRHEEERARLEAQLQQSQKLESVGRLAGGVAHDFNNMLGVILGHSELALMSLHLPPSIIKNLEEIRSAAERSAELTRQLLAFARKQTVAPKVLDLNEAVAEMLNMLQRLIGEDIHLVWQPTENLWAVNMDPTQIGQILANLCVNARDAITDTGEINIMVKNSTIEVSDCSAPEDAVPGDYVQLLVCDSGCGMDKKTISQIFEPFFTTKETGKGTGLGLSTVYGIVKQNHGFIRVNSEPGQGTSFSVYLPRYTGNTRQAQIESTLKPASRGHETILLVEDELAILNMTSMILTEQGYNVLAANTPVEAIQLAREYTDEIHLLMTDVIMPEMNGRDLAKNLLSLHPNIKRLFMSGYTADIIAHHGVIEDGVHFIQKPFPVQNLTSKLRELLDGD